MTAQHANLAWRSQGAPLRRATDHAAYERRRHYALDYVLREWLRQPGMAFFYENTTIVGPRTAHQVTIGAERKHTNGAYPQLNSQ